MRQPALSWTLLRSVVEQAAKPEKVAELYRKIEAYEATAFNPHRGSTAPQSCEAAEGEYGGFWGPFLP